MTATLGNRCLAELIGGCGSSKRRGTPPSLPPLFPWHDVLALLLLLRHRRHHSWYFHRQLCGGKRTASKVSQGV